MSNSLGIEYRQWVFCKELTRSFRNWLGCSNTSSADRKKDAENTLQRWLLSIQQKEFQFDKQTPLFPLIQEKHFLNETLCKEILEKHFVNSVDQSFLVLQRLLNAISEWRHVCHQNPSPEAPLPTMITRDNCKAELTIGNFKSPCNERIYFLCNHFDVNETATMLLRYEAMGNGSYQWGDPLSVHKLLHSEFHARYEGFASPLNSRFLELDGAKFCSLFSDTDKVFGSLGNFFDANLLDHEGGWTVNPPFIELVLERAAHKVLSALQDGARSYFFMTFPHWDDCVGWNLLNESHFKVERFDLQPKKFCIQDAYGAILQPKMKLSIFIVGKLPSDCCSSVGRIYEVASKLIRSVNQ